MVVILYCTIILGREKIERNRITSSWKQSWRVISLNRLYDTAIRENLALQRLPGLTWVRTLWLQLNNLWNLDCILLVVISDPCFQCFRNYYRHLVQGTINLWRLYLTRQSTIPTSFLYIMKSKFQSKKLSYVFIPLFLFVVR